MSLGENIARLRTERGWSQIELAERMEVSHQSISKWETDTSVPELDRLLRLSELFGLTLDELVKGEGTEKKPEPEPAPPRVETVVIEKSEHSTLRIVFGVILLCLGGLISALSLFMIGQGGIGLLLIAAPLLACGIICLTVKRRTGLWCGWAVYLGVDLHLRFNAGINWTGVLAFLFNSALREFTVRSGNFTNLYLMIGMLLALVLMVLLTLWAYRGVVCPPTRRNLLLLLAGWAVYALRWMIPMTPAFLDAQRRMAADLDGRSIRRQILLQIPLHWVALAMLTALLILSLGLLRGRKKKS